jgi:hypothetical protein
MKESWMDKLIELLNEFDENRKIWKNWLYKWEEYDPREEYIISKNFWFIKWLVDNDKIDFDKLKPLTWVTEIMLATNYPNWIEVKRRYRLYEQLIMLLSIQDNPIEFLVSILK